MPLVLTASANPGTASWTDSSTFVNTPGSWTAITDLSAGVTASVGGSGDFPQLAYRTNGDGTVYLRGACYPTGATANNGLFTLPAAVRPNGDTIFSCIRIVSPYAPANYGLGVLGIRPIGHGNAGLVYAESATIGANQMWVFNGVTPYCLTTT